MIAAIDIGNTNVVIGCIEKGSISFTARLRTDIQKTDCEYASLLMDMFSLHGIDPAEIEGSIIASVVPPMRAVMQSAMRQLTGKTPLMVGAGVKTGLNILTDNPAQVGSDLIVGAVAALDKYPLPMLIFDFGTATTAVALDDAGNYIGYMIIPGLRSSVDSLASKTSQLPFISLEAPDSLLGKNTVDAMRAGAIFGNAAMMDGIIDRVEKEVFGKKATIVATGGLAKSVAKHCSHEIICDDDLLLHGLWLLYQKNHKKKK